MGLAPGRGKGEALRMASQGECSLSTSDFFKGRIFGFHFDLKVTEGDISATSSQMAHKNNMHTQTMQKQIWHVSD